MYIASVIRSKGGGGGGVNKQYIIRNFILKYLLIELEIWVILIANNSNSI